MYASSTVTDDVIIETFYEALEEAMKKTSQIDRLAIVTGFYAKFVRTQDFSEAIGLLGVGKSNERGELRTTGYLLRSWLDSMNTWFGKIQGIHDCC